ncbi:PWI domain-containing protein [Lizonia empirigonia]|nr:PWI domain-containing protein [Lizonia empirigonia]
MVLSIDQKRLKATKFPPEFDRKVDIEKVNIDLMKKWIAQKITNILGDEDDIVVETCYNLVEQNQFPNIKEIQIQLTGFLNKDTAAFCKELWDLMLSAQDSPMGVPKEMLEAKKLELQQEQLSKAAAESRRKEQTDQDDIVNMFRDTDRPDRGDRGDRSRGRGGRGGGFRGDQDAGHHLAVSVTSTSPAVAAAGDEIVGAVLENAAAHLQTAVLGLHRLVALAAPPLQIVHARPRDVEDGPLQVIAQDLYHADRDALLLHAASETARKDTNHGLLATTAEGYLDINHDLLPLKRKQAHQHPGCQGHDPALHRAAAAAAPDQAVHGL